MTGPVALTRGRLLAVGAVLVALVLAATVALVSGGSGDARAQPAAGGHVSPSVRGTITAVDGDTWTVAAEDGVEVTVLLDGATTFGTARHAATREQFTVGAAAAVVGERDGAVVTARRVIAPMSVATPMPPAPATTPAAPALVGSESCALDAAAQAAVDVATSRGERAAVAVLDTTTGALSTAGEATEEMRTASVVKVLVATQLLLTGQMTEETSADALAMIAQSDDWAADGLYDLAGGDEVLPLVAAHYGITDLGSPPEDFGQWGATGITARGLVELYSAVRADPVVWPWLSTAMGATTEIAADGTDQSFGLPSVAEGTMVKQGWMTGLGPGSTYNSTGYLDGGRYAVAILTYGEVWQYGDEMAGTLTDAAAALLPGGVVPTGPCAA